jgi:hypothetical protein
MDELQGWHAACSVRDVFQHSAFRPSTEVFIVDSLLAAPVALDAHRPREESTYVLCRAARELGTAFKQRVLRRATQIRAHRYIGSLWYVMGKQASEPSGSVLLLQELLPLLETGARLTLASPCSQGQLVFDWLASLLGQRRSDIDMGVRFYPDSIYPAAIQPDVVRPDVVRPDVVRPAAIQPDVVRPEAVHADGAGLRRAGSSRSMAPSLLDGVGELQCA